MKTFTNNTIRSWSPCYDPAEKYPDEATQHTVITILDDENLSHADRIWVIMRTDLVSEKLMRLFAVHCARTVVDKTTDERSINAINVAERFANGEANEADLSAAESAAWYAAESAASSAARSAARSAQREHLRKMIITGIETGDVKP